MAAEPAVTGFTPGPVSTIPAPAPLSFGGLHSPPPFDVIELLPERSQERLRKLRLRRDDAHAVAVPFADIQEASAAKVDAQRTLSRLVDHRSTGSFELPPGDGRVVAAQRHLDKMTDDLKRLQERSEARAAAFQATSQALASVESWLRHGMPGNCQIEEVAIEPPKLLKNESVLDGIERLRRRARELKADQHRIRSAPFPSNYAKQRMREQIEALAMQGAPSVSSLIELDGKIEFQTQRLTSEVHAAQRALAFTEVPDTIALTLLAAQIRIDRRA